MLIYETFSEKTNIRNEKKQIYKSVFSNLKKILKITTLEVHSNLLKLIINFID